MNKTFKYMFGAFVVGFGMVSCSPDDFSGATVGDVPSTSPYQVKVDVNIREEVDEETKEVSRISEATFNFYDADGNVPEGVYPVWTLPNGTVSTANGYKADYIIAGDYKFSWRVANRNGVSDDIQNATFHVDEGLDVDQLMADLTGGGTKKWRVFANGEKHLGVGPSWDDASGWWGAAPQEKSKEGIYDDEITITATDLPGMVQYDYSAGPDGLTFIKGDKCGNWWFGPSKAGDGGDWSDKVLGVEGIKGDASMFIGRDKETKNFTLQLPAKIAFPWIGDKGQMEKGVTFQILDLNDKTMTLAWITDDKGMWFQIILISGDDVNGPTTSEINKFLTDGSSKEWHVYSKGKGHLGVGPNWDRAAEWWSADPNAKESEGIYDDVITFTTTNQREKLSYKYSAGPDGLTFIKDMCSNWWFGPSKASDGGDWSDKVIGVEGITDEATAVIDNNYDTGEVFIELPAKVAFPWIGDKGQLEKGAKFRVVSMEDGVLTLAWPTDDGNMWFQIQLVNGDGPGGFDPADVNWASVNSDANLAKSLQTLEMKVDWLEGNDWSPNPNGYSYELVDGIHRLTVKSPLNETWRGQWHFNPCDVAFEANTYYDYSFEIRSIKATDMKLTFKCEKYESGGNPNSIEKGGIEVGTEWKTVQFAKIKCGDSWEQSNICFAVGQNAAEGDVYEVRNIIIQKHNPK